MFCGATQCDKKHWTLVYFFLPSILFKTLLAPLVITLALLVLFWENDEALLEGVEEVIDDFREELAVDFGVAPFGDIGETGDIGDIGDVAVSGLGVSLDGFTEVAAAVLEVVVAVVVAFAGVVLGAGLAAVVVEASLAGAGTLFIAGD